MAAIGILLLFAIGITAFVGLIAFVVVQFQQQRARTDQVLNAARDRYGGRLEDSFWYGKKLKFPVDAQAGISAELSYFRGSDKAPPFTKLHIRWPGPPLRVHPEKGWGSIKKLFGAQDIQIGDSSFDDMFLIQGESEFVHKALTPEVRRKLRLLYTLGKTHGFFGGNRAGISLDVTPSGVFIKCLRNLTRETHLLLSFLEHALAVFAELRAATHNAPQVSVEEVVKAGKCPVCSDSSGTLSKRCSQCRAAYHPECWSYLGGCAIFGCGDRYRPERAREASW